MSDAPRLLVETRDRVRVLTINRPEARNAWSRALELALHEEFEDADADVDVGAIVITGAGDAAFSAGADLKDPATHRISTVEEYIGALRIHSDPPWLRPILDCRKPVIGAINGYTVGAGCSIAMACDFLLGSPNAEFRFPQASLGILPIYGGAPRLAQWIGRGRAMELVLTGRPLLAEEAHSFGLLSRVVAGDQLLEAAVQVATMLAGFPPLGVAMTKESLKSGLETDSLRSASTADMYRYLGLLQTEESIDRHARWRRWLHERGSDSAED